MPRAATYKKRRITKSRRRVATAKERTFRRVLDVVTLVLLVVLCGAGVWVLGRVWQASRRHPLAPRVAAARMLAAHVSRNYSGLRVLVVANPFAAEPDSPQAVARVQTAALKGVKAGLRGRAGHDVAYPELKADLESVVVPPASTTPLSYLMTEEAFDKLAAAHPDCKIFLSIIGLPARMDKVEFWKRADPPALALLLPDLAVLGRAEALRAAFAAGQIVGVVVEKPDAPAEDTLPPGNYREMFARRFLLLTRDNVDDVLDQYPGLL